MTSNAKVIWDYLKKQGLNDYGIAGLMGNLYAESGLSPINLQNTYEKILGFSDDEYTKAVDDGSYGNFVYDKAGYGLAQWTYYSRKQGLFDYAKSLNQSIGDLEMQLGYLVRELQAFGLLAVLKQSTSVLDASNTILLQFEKPLDQSEQMQKIRAEYGQKFYDLFAEKEKATENHNVSVSGNSPLAVVTIISPNQSGKRNHKIDRISPHCVVGQCTAEALGAWFAQKNANASSNYGIDKDGRVGMYVEEDCRSWCTSSNANDQRAVTIECASDNFAPYRMNDEVYQTLIDLCVDICKRNGKDTLLWFGDKDYTLAYEPKDNEMVITVHRWFANKSCPGNWLYERLGDLAAKVTAKLHSEEDENMTIERFTELMHEYRAGLQDNDHGAWSEEAAQWAIQNGLIQGGGNVNGQPNYMYQDFMTREQLITVLYRFAQLMGKA